MAMNRILEFSPSQEEAVVSRILVLLHQAIDESFPSVAQNSRQFTKTVFSGDGEPTAVGRPGEDSPGGRAAFAGEEVTASDARAATEDEARQPESRAAPHIPPPPVRVPDPPPPRPTVATGYSKHPGSTAKSRADSRAATNLDATMEGINSDQGPDWISRLFVALFIAGAMLLAYALLA